MESANIPSTSWNRPRAPQPDPPPHVAVHPPRAQVTARSLLVFLVLASILAGLTLRVLATGYVSAEALARWAKVLAYSGLPAAPFETMGVSSPQVPIHLLMPLYFVPGLRTGAAPYLLSVVLGACLLALWYGQLARRGMPRLVRSAYVLLILIHPFFLWLATSGNRQMVSIFIHYLFCVLLVRVAETAAARWLMLSGFTIVLGFLSDERYFYLFLVMFPLIPLLMTDKMSQTGPGAFYVVVCFPIAFMIFSWLYINWVFQWDPFHFLRNADSPFVGAWNNAPYLAWLQTQGGKIFSPLGWVLLLTLCTAPVLPVLALRNLHRERYRRLAFAVVAMPVLGAVLATYLNHLNHPVDMLVFLVPVIMALVANSSIVTWRQHALPLGLLLVGVLGGWDCYIYFPTTDMRQWARSMFLGERAPKRFQSEKALGEWLKDNRLPTVMDDRVGYPALVARGDAHGIYLPHSAEFQRSIQLKHFFAEQFAVPNPSIGDGFRDTINREMPTLYARGQDDYQLVYDTGNWRVYRRIRPLRAAAAKPQAR